MVRVAMWWCDLEVDEKTGVAVQGPDFQDEDLLTQRLTALLKGGATGSMLGVLPAGAELPAEPSRMLLRTALLRAGREMLRGSLSADSEIIWAVKTLANLDREVNTLAELTDGWVRARSLADVGGAPAEPEGIDALRELVEKMRAVIADEEAYLEDRMRALAPNLSEACGPKLGAQLIELAGGLRELAMRPSSTVQVMGAEKAMFRHLRGEAAPPKHGLIFQHPTVQFAPKKDRGKAARKLAARIVMAARKDAFTTQS